MIEYQHPDSPNSESFSMDKAISLITIKLTNDKTAKFTEKVYVLP